MIAGELFRLAERHPQAPAIAGARQRWTYLQLVDAARSIALSLVDEKVNRVGVWCDETPALVATLVALDASGIDAVLISAASTVDHVDKLAERLMLSAIVTDKDPIPECSTPHSLRFRQIDFTGPKIAPNFQPRRRDAEVILFTSGTSGRPKAGDPFVEHACRRRESRSQIRRSPLVVGLRTDQFCGHSSMAASTVNRRVLVCFGLSRSGASWPSNWWTSASNSPRPRRASGDCCCSALRARS